MNFINNFYKEKYTLHKLDSFITFLDSLDESKFNYIYVHIPKNAGTTIRKRLKNMKDCIIINHTDELNHKREIINLKHTCFTNYQFPKKLICFVRNPYTRCLSMFFYHKINKKYNNNFSKFISDL